VYDSEVEALTAALTPAGLKAAIKRFRSVRAALSHTPPDSSVRRHRSRWPTPPQRTPPSLPMVPTSKWSGCP